MTIYLRDYLHFSQAVASAMNSVFNTLVYLTPLVGGYVADAHLGRYATIALFGAFYLVGTSLMAVASLPSHEDKPLFMVAFFGLVALGAGGIKSNVVTMGGDQFNLDYPEESAQKDTYFVYFYCEGAAHSAA
jgi:dipeptide/tripeptide permease